MENIVITEYSLFEFLSRVEKEINNGYAFDFTTNENFPTAFGNMYYAVMIPKSKEEVPVISPQLEAEEIMTQVATEEELVLLPEDDPVEIPEPSAEPTPARRGRPSKKTAPD